MKSILKIADAFFEYLLPLYLVVVSLLLTLPSLGEGGNHRWFKFDLLPTFFDSNAKLIIVLPLVLFTIGLGAKHMRLVWTDRLPRRLWGLALLGTICALLIVTTVYFTLRIDAFWLNIPSLSAYIYIRFAEIHPQAAKPASRFLAFAGRNSRLMFSAVCLYLSLFIVLATGVRFELLNQNSSFLETQMKEQTKNLIGTYQSQHTCFGNKVSYQTNLFFQVLVLEQPFDVECADSITLTEAIQTLGQMIAMGEDVDFIRLQSFAALIVRFAGKGMDEATATQFDAVFHGSPDANELCTTDDRFCIVRKIPQQSSKG
jgi:hypothetical protein